MGVNSAGLSSKLTTFRKVISELKPSVFFIQETKFKTEGKLKLENYTIFELVRKSKDGGGLAIGCENHLKPAWVREGNDDVEALSVDIFLNGMKIRCCAAYGCQEGDPLERKNKFWEYLNQEVEFANNTNAGLIIQFDGNLWAGHHIVPGDPRPQNRNGKLFENFLNRNPRLTVVNSLPLCQGLITRRRMKNGVQEESVLDFFVVCSRILPHVQKMYIDEENKYVLTNYKTAQLKGNAIDSDHKTEYMDLNIKIIHEKPIRREFFNFRDLKGQEVFKTQTSETQEFTRCFENELPVLEQIELWRKVLKKYCSKSFKKIRVTIKKRTKFINKEMANLINQRNKLLKMKQIIFKNCDVISGEKSGQEKHASYKHKCDENLENYETEIRSIEKTVSDIEAKEHRELILKNFKSFNENPETVNIAGIWKLFKKLWPKHANVLPVAKKNHLGKIVSSPSEIKSLLSKEYKERLRNRPLKPEFQHLKDLKSEIFQLKMKNAEKNASAPWKMSHLESALSHLKNNKSRDPEGYINEIFKCDVAGQNLKQSLLVMCNKLKQEKKISDFMNIANITTVPKKGSRLLLKNERGIFRVSVVRNILMRMIYDSKYPEINSNMTDSQMGGRKGMGCRNNIFILNGIIHEENKRKKEPIMFQIYDYAQMFDSINLQEAISDIYDCGFRDDMLPLVYKANAEVQMAVNTPHGLTDRIKIRNTVLQGDTFGSILASVQVNSIGKLCEQSDYGYKYKNKLSIPMLGLVDDVIGISEVGTKAHQMNALINAKTAEKGLRFGPEKCKTMIVGKDIKSVDTNPLVVDNWKTEHITDEITGEPKLIESFDGKIQIEQVLQQKYLGFVIANQNNNMANIEEVKRKSIGITKKIFDKLNGLKLKEYYFECGLIFLNVILRGSILYAAETYYNLKEKELRILERIEENFMRKLLQTKASCPVVQLYLELSQIPARFAIMKSRLLFLKSILNEKEGSRIHQFVKLQLDDVKKGDWIWTCLEDLKDIGFKEPIKEVKEMKTFKFRKIVTARLKERAFEYLLNKQGIKGREIKYNEFQMAEYLLPNETLKSIEDQRYLFAIRNKMIEIPSNIGKEEKCICGKIESMSHIYYCYGGEKEIHYEKVYNGKLIEREKVLNSFRDNMKIRETKIQEIASRSTNFCNDISNGIHR